MSEKVLALQSLPELSTLDLDVCRLMATIEDSCKLCSYTCCCTA